MENETTHRSGFVAIVGAPNVGKSTFLNKVLGTKLAITSSRPQTTRNRILGVWNRPGSQIIFLDTPGIHRPQSRLHHSMVQAALGALAEVDLVLWVVDCLKERGPEEKIILDHLKKVESPVVAALNKIDRIEPPKLLPQIKRLAEMELFRAIVPISALKGEGLKELTEELGRHLSPGQPLFPEDMLTDQPERFLAAEYVREKVFRKTGQEVPFGVAVSVTDFQERKEKELIYIRAVIHVERESHKGIIIGARGARLKEIGQEARADMERLLGTKVFLELFVRVEKDWTKKTHLVRRMGYEL